MLKQIRQFFKEYRQLGLVVIAIIISLGLDLVNQDRIAHIILGTTGVVTIIPLLTDMLHTLRSGQYGIDILAITAIVTSIILGEYWAGIVIVLMLTGGVALEDYAESRAKTELTALLQNKPKKAHLIKNNKTTDVRVSSVTAGDKLIIYPGEIVPVDCTVTEGVSSVDESSLTGESLPIDKNAGSDLLSGSINIDGVLTVRASRAAEDSQYQQIIKLVRAAAVKQSPFVRLADRYSVPFTIVSFFIAGTVWIITGDPVRFLEVLVVATPCPLLLAAPIALISGMSRAARHGIIIRTGSALEKLAEVETIAFDKTGTLTKGTPIVSAIEAYNGYTQKDVVSFAAALEQNSNHVLASAIINEATKQKVKILNAKLVKEVAGRGVSGRIQGKSIAVGRISLLDTEAVSSPKNLVMKFKQTASYVSVDDKLAGIITFTDELRPESRGMLARLKKAGIKHTLMVTGDNAETAKSIAKQLAISDVKADCLPADKITAIENTEYKPVAFVGDGVNDAPVLTVADVGIALGARGSTAASQSADVVILLDDVSKVASSVEIAKRTFSIARQSILIGILISFGLMALFSTGKFRAVHGAIAQELVDIIVIVNALRAHSSGRKSR